MLSEICSGKEIHLCHILMSLRYVMGLVPCHFQHNFTVCLSIHPPIHMYIEEPEKLAVVDGSYISVCSQQHLNTNVITLDTLSLHCSSDCRVRSVHTFWVPWLNDVLS